METKRPRVFLLDNGGLFGPAIEGDFIHAFYTFTTIDLANKYRAERTDIPLTLESGLIFDEHLKSLAKEQSEEETILVIDAGPKDTNIEATDLHEVFSALNTNSPRVPLKYKLVLNNDGNYEIEK